MTPGNRPNANIYGGKRFRNNARGTSLIEGHQGDSRSFPENVAGHPARRLRLGDHTRLDARLKLIGLIHSAMVSSHPPVQSGCLDNPLSSSSSSQRLARLGYQTVMVCGREEGGVCGVGVMSGENFRVCHLLTKLDDRHLGYKARTSVCVAPTLDL
jgi:hypothetical protein